MDKVKLLKTSEIFDSYEKRFARARAEKPFSINKTENERMEILTKVKKMLGYDDSLVPTVHALETVSSLDMGNFSVDELRYQTWDDVYSSASLYLPKREGKLPLVFLMCGHGDYGRLNKGYSLMATRLALMGFAVIVPDNIGQGDREFMGHWHSIGPFYSGLTLQGLIAMESVALIRYMTADSRFDKTRFAAIGNSGGGTLTLMLSALCPEISVLSSSGYPSEFHYILSKERPHCSCNLLKGCAFLEMWEIYSLFAPKPMLLEQGLFDNLIAVEYFERNKRKLEAVYALMDAKDNFEAKKPHTKHPWDKEDREIISDFLSRRLGVCAVDIVNEEMHVSDDLPSERRVTMPKEAIDTDTLCEKLSGKKMPVGTLLSDIFKPVFGGAEIKESEIIEDLGRGSVMRVFAQMECALTKLE